MVGLVGLVSLIAITMGIYGLIRGKVVKLGIATRKTAALVFGGGFILLMVAGALTPKPRPENESKPNDTIKTRLESITTPSAKAFAPAASSGENNSPPPIQPEYILPADQRAFIDSVSAHRNKYVAAANELQKSSVRRERKVALAAILQDLKIHNWRGKLMSMGTNSDGKAHMTVELATGIRIKTWNNALSDMASHTLIEPQSETYQVLMNLREGDYVQFSGQFLSDDQDFVDESSLTEGGSMRSPEFVFRFNEISKAAVR